MVTTQKHGWFSFRRHPSTMSHYDSPGNNVYYSSNSRAILVRPFTSVVCLIFLINRWIDGLGFTVCRASSRVYNREPRDGGRGGVGSRYDRQSLRVTASRATAELNDDFLLVDPVDYLRVSVNTTRLRINISTNGRMMLASLMDRWTVYTVRELA